MGSATSVQSIRREGYSRSAQSEEDSVATVDISTHTAVTLTDMATINRATFGLHAMRLNRSEALLTEDLEDNDGRPWGQDRSPMSLIQSDDLVENELHRSTARRVSMVSTLAAISEEDSAKSENIRRLSNLHNQNLAALILIDLQKIITEPCLVPSSMLVVVDDLPFSLTLSSASSVVRGFPLLYVNKEFEHTTGYCRSQVLGGSAKCLQCAETSPSHTAALNQALQAGQSCKLVILNQRKDGMQFYNLLALQPLRNRVGEVTHVIGIQMDISEEKASERETQSMEEHLSLLPTVIAPYTSSEWTSSKLDRS